jgi:cyclase
MVRRVADAVFLPFTVGGGVRSVEDADALLRAGADKVAVNTAAVEDPALLERLSQRFGSQAVVLAIDARRAGQGFEVFTHGGRRGTGKDAVAWASEGRPPRRRRDPAHQHGPGRHQGRLRHRADARRGRCGARPRRRVGRLRLRGHMAEVLGEGHASAALCASLFHFGEIRIPDAKAQLLKRGVAVRPA